VHDARLDDYRNAARLLAARLDPLAGANVGDYARLLLDVADERA